MENVRESFKRILAQKCAHEALRYQLELALETAPRDSRYSQQLVDMMRKEENYVREGRPTNELNKRVDDALAVETTTFFEKVAQSNVKRWMSLSARLDSDREQLRSDILRLMYHNRMNTTGLIQPTVTILDPLDAEEKRLEQIYNQRWFEFEGHNLEEAFRAQKTRLDSEWESHRSGLSESYRIRKKTLLGSDTLEVPASDKSRNSSDARWHQAEKQKTLIHTAPVLTPTAQQMSREATDREKAVGSAVRAVRNRTADGPTSAVQRQLQLELENLEAEYKKSLDSMELQKDGAVRWMMRQKIRLMSHAQVVQMERRAIGAVLQAEIDHTNAMGKLLNETGGSVAGASAGAGAGMGTGTGGANTTGVVGGAVAGAGAANPVPLRRIAESASGGSSAAVSNPRKDSSGKISSAGMENGHGLPVRGRLG